MKKFENFTTEDLQKLRSEIVLNSLYTADYCNSFGISERSVCAFFDGYMSFLEEICKEDNKETTIENILHYDNIDTLEVWYNCLDDFDWVEYVQENED